jgi:hypothetical protein
MRTGSASGMFSVSGSQPPRRGPGSAAPRGPTSSQYRGGAGHVGRHVDHLRGRLEGQAAGIEGPALADERDDRGRPLGPIGQPNQPGGPWGATSDPPGKAAEPLCRDPVLVPDRVVQPAGGGDRTGAVVARVSASPGSLTRSLASRTPRATARPVRSATRACAMSSASRSIRCGPSGPDRLARVLEALTGQRVPTRRADRAEAGGAQVALARLQLVSFPHQPASQPENPAGQARSGRWVA